MLLFRYPGGLGWQLKVQKAVVRKQPEFKKFQDFLVYETDVVSTTCWTLGWCLADVLL